MQLDHIVLNVKDINASVKFYAEVLNLEVQRLEEYQAGEAPFPFVRINEDTIIDLFPPEQRQKDDATSTTQNLNHFCLAMPHSVWIELQARLEEYNIVIESGPVQRGGAKGMGTSIYFRDPDNNQIEARYYQ